MVRSCTALGNAPGDSNIVQVAAGIVTYIFLFKITKSFLQIPYYQSYFL